MFNALHPVSHDAAGLFDAGIFGHSIAFKH